MTAVELMAALRRQGVELWADGERLRYSAPKGVLTPDVRAQLANHKSEILVLLSQVRPLQPIPRDGKLPLSFTQERFWFFDHMEPGNTVYNIPLAFHVTGPLDTQALERSFNEIVRRHEVLRATCAADGGQPFLIIAPEATLTLPVVDLRRLPPTEQDVKVRQLTAEEARRPFDLTRGPMLRATVLRLAEQEFVLLVTTHHFVADGWSMGVLHRELSHLYDAFSTGTPPSLPELPIQYVDFAHWQREQMQGGTMEAQLAYWKKQLADAPIMLELPTDRPRPPVQTYRGASIPFTIAPPLDEALRQLSREEAVTLFMTLLTSFQTLLYRYTAQPDIIVSTVVSNRHRIETENLIGTFANNVPLRTSFDGNPTFREMLGRVREMSLEAYARQEFPFEKLVAELHPERDLSHTPFLQAMFVLHQGSVNPKLRLSGLDVRPLLVEKGTTITELNLRIVDREKRLDGTLGYNTDLFDAATIQRMIGHFQTLLEAIVADPDERIGTLPLLTEAERRQLIYEWNQTRRDYPHDKCIHQLIEEQAERAPDQIALIHGEQEITYRELNQRSNQLARYLQKKGVGPEMLVAVAFERSPELLIAALAILKAGGAIVGLDPSHPAERLSYVLQDTGAKIVITRESFADRVVNSGVQIVAIDSAWSEIGKERAANPESAVRSENLAYAVYTSGSTGRPKGILVTHRSFVNFALSAAERYKISAADRRFQFASPSSELFVSGSFSTLMCGATLIQRPDQEFPAIADFVQFIEERQITWFTLPSAYWHEWMTLVRDGRAHVPSSLRTLVLGMDKLRPDLFDLWRQRVGPRIGLFNTYGPAETTCVSSVYQADVSTSDELVSVPIGRPIANTRIYLLDQYHNPVPVGVIGELYIGGHGVARGYIGRPDLTAERFVPDGLSDTPGERLYRTGDLARYRPDGNIEFIGRADHQVKVRGFRVELGKIEAVLRQHPMVRQAIVVAQKEDAGDKRLAAYVVVGGDAPINLSELRRFLRERLPEYMVPSAFMVLEKFPMTRTGKVDRLALPAAEPIRSEPDENFVAPRTEMEALLADIWQEALKVDRVGVYDNFFNLGGHSLLSLQVIDKIEKQVGLRITPKDLIFQTLAQLAAACDERRRDGSAAEPMSATRKLWSGLRKVVLGAGEDRQ